MIIHLSLSLSLSLLFFLFECACMSGHARVSAPTEEGMDELMSRRDFFYFFR